VGALTPPPAPVGWVLYDADCGICFTGATRLGPTFAALGLATAALQEPWVAERTGLPADELLRDLIILFADGSLLRGVAAYRWVLRRRWWGWPLWLVTSVPPGSWLGRWGYRMFAGHRHQIARLCRLQGRQGR
jgi:predicted DCC family thiol-disulfide oxidoreductase YuxK